MTVSALAHISSAAGEIIIAYTVLSVHSHVMKERKIDRDVFYSMKKERVVGFLGIFFILLGLGLELLPGFFS